MSRSARSELLIFRPEESTTTIIVSDRLRAHLLARGFDKLEFIERSDAFQP